MSTTPFIDALPSPPFRPTLPELLRWAAQQWGERELLVFDGERLTFQALEVRSARLACHLLRQGAGKGTRIGLWMGNTPAWLECFFAITRIGAVAVPLSTFLQPPELRWVVQHADLALLLMADRVLHHDQRARLEAALPELAGQQAPLLLQGAPYLRRIFVRGECDRTWAEPLDATSDASLWSPAASTLLPAVQQAVSPADAAVLMYTSGSTSLPKGCTEQVRGNGIGAIHIKDLRSASPNFRYLFSAAQGRLAPAWPVAAPHLGIGAGVLALRRRRPRRVDATVLLDRRSGAVAHVRAAPGRLRGECFPALASGLATTGARGTPDRRSRARSLVAGMC